MAATAKPVASDVRRRRHADDGERLPHTRDSDGQHQQRPKRPSSGKKYTSVPHARGLLLGVVAFYVLGLSLVAYLYTWLPPALDVDAPATQFSEARARVVLENIMGFGYHPVGTRANEELIPNYLISEVRPYICVSASLMRASSHSRMRVDRLRRSAHKQVPTSSLSSTSSARPVRRTLLLCLHSHTRTITHSLDLLAQAHSV